MSKRKVFYICLLALPAAGMILTVYLPFVNRPAVWLGLPSVMVWTIIWVALTTAVLALVEWGAPHPEDDEETHR